VLNGVRYLDRDWLSRAREIVESKGVIDGVELNALAVKYLREVLDER